MILRSTWFYITFQVPFYQSDLVIYREKEYQILKQSRISEYPSHKHLPGSACCSSVYVNTTLTLNIMECMKRCYHSECDAWVRSETGECWLLEIPDVTFRDIIILPAKERTTGISIYTNRETNLDIHRKCNTHIDRTLISFLNENYPQGVGVVLGVGRGERVINLLTHWERNGGLYLVDPYIHIWKGYYDTLNNLDDVRMQLTYENLRLQLRNAGIPEWKHVFLRDFSYALSKWWIKKEMHSPTLILVDANLSEKSVMRDLYSWYPLLDKGGVIAGTCFGTHDGNIQGSGNYSDYSIDGNKNKNKNKNKTNECKIQKDIGVKSAVENFFNESRYANTHYGILLLDPPEIKENHPDYCCGFKDWVVTKRL